MTQQFSKLNKFSPSFKKNRTKQAKFTIGKDDQQNDSSTDTDEESDNNIFEPHVSTAEMAYIESNSSSASGCPEDSYVERALEVTEDMKLVEKRKVDLPETYLPGVGIVMGAANDACGN